MRTGRRRAWPSYPLGPGDGSVGDPYCSIQTAIAPIPVCPGDITSDGEVGINDFLDLLAAWKTVPLNTRREAVPELE